MFIINSYIFQIKKKIIIYNSTKALQVLIHLKSVKMYQTTQQPLQETIMLNTQTISKDVITQAQYSEYKKFSNYPAISSNYTKDNIFQFKQCDQIRKTFHPSSKYLYTSNIPTPKQLKINCHLHTQDSDLSLQIQPISKIQKFSKSYSFSK